MEKGCQGCLVAPLAGAEGALGVEGAEGALEAEGTGEAAGALEVEGAEEAAGTAELLELPELPTLTFAMASAETAFFPYSILIAARMLEVEAPF